MVAGLRWKKRANQERSGPAEGGLSSLDGAGDAEEKRESSELLIIVVPPVTRVSSQDSDDKAKNTPTRLIDVLFLTTNSSPQS